MTLSLNRFSCQKAFRDMLTEINDQAGQHEVVAENLTLAVTKEIVALVKDFKEDRKRVSLVIADYCLVFNRVNALFGISS